MNYIHTLNIDEPLSRIKSDGSVRYYQTDALGSIIGLTTEDGQLATVYTYDPFGNVTVSGEPSDNPFQYTGRENDRTGLYYYRARYYNPELQRFISEDPIRLRGGINFFSYVENSPINWVDPEGLKRICVYPSGGTYVGISHKIFPYLHNVLFFKLPCGPNKKAVNPYIDKSQAQTKARPEGKKSLERETAFNLVYFESKCNEPGLAIVEIETRIITQPGAIGFLLKNVKVCYECECCK